MLIICKVLPLHYIKNWSTTITATCNYMPSKNPIKLQTLQALLFIKHNIQSFKDQVHSVCFLTPTQTRLESTLPYEQTDTPF